MRRIGELGGSLGPFLLPSPLFSLPRTPIYIFLLFQPVFLSFSSTAEPGPRLRRIVDGRYGALSSKYGSLCTG